jgi:tRNA-specific 2-thiouridylase
MSFVNKSKKIAVALSGGVDSAIAVYLCKQRGYDCVGVTMGLPDNDISGAEAVAERFDIPLITIDACSIFAEKVITPFASGYIKGETPNPCVECNRDIKFDFLQRSVMEKENTDYFATGHYTQVIEKNGRFLLKKAADESKDQSYYLYQLKQEQLEKTVFPLGGYLKKEIKEIARELNLFNANKPESQDICFIPDGSYGDYIRAMGHDSIPGNFCDINGNIIGQHKGLVRYTVGQRKGLGLSWHSPLFVHAKDAETNTIILCTNEQLFSDTLTAHTCNWLIETPADVFRAKARIRCRQNEQWATITPTSNDTFNVQFDEPQRAAAKGQHVVLYDEDLIIGGGVIG